MAETKIYTLMPWDEWRFRVSKPTTITVTADSLPMVFDEVRAQEVAELRKQISELEKRNDILKEQLWQLGGEWW